MHDEQIDFCKKVKKKYPNHFKKKRVLDVGSLDINGNNRYLFKNCHYLGLDIVAGNNVDIVCHVHELIYDNPLPIFNTIICTEMLEHDKHWKKSLTAMYLLLKKGGLLLITAAGINRPEHGTTKTTPEDSPGTNNYYRNISAKMIEKVYNYENIAFKLLEITNSNSNNDIGVILIK